MTLLSIRTHLLLLVLAMAIPLIGALGVGIYADMQNTISLSKKSLRALAESMVANTGKNLYSTQVFLESVARRPRTKLLDAENCDPILQDLSSLKTAYINIEVAGLDGNLVCSAIGRPAPKFDVRQVAQRQVTMARYMDKWVIYLGAPIVDAQQRMIGVVRMTLDLQELDPRLPAQLLPVDSRYGFFREDGVMVWRNLDPEGVIGTKPNAEAAREIVRIKDGEFASLAIDGVTRYFSVVPMPQTGWVAFVGVPDSTVYAPAKRRAFAMSAVAIAAITLLLLVAIFIARRISQAQQASNLQLRIAAATFESHQGIIVTDPNDVILKVNQTFSDISGYATDEVIGRKSSILHSGRQDAEFYKTLWNSVITTGAWEGEIWNRLKNGEIRLHWLTISAVKDNDVITNYVGVYSDITERKRMEDQVRQLAFYDTLTNLPNRRLLNDRLGHAMAGNRRSGCFGAMIFLDLDNFKPLNDRHGHGVGDLLLMEVASRIRNCVREVDTVGRFGGDEFVVMLPELSADRIESTNLAKIVAEKIRIALAEPYSLAIDPDTIVMHHCSASIGISLFSGHETSQDDILKWADAAMYKAKDAGRNAIQFYEALPA
jgi:diguanylate cyclase (GGDEF)-like protein/PAS domain S-box-containing protein